MKLKKKNIQSQLSLNRENVHKKLKACTYYTSFRKEIKNQYPLDILICVFSLHSATKLAIYSCCDLQCTI